MLDSPPSCMECHIFMCCSYNNNICEMISYYIIHFYVVEVVSYNSYTTFILDSNQSYLSLTFFSTLLYFKHIICLLYKFHLHLHYVLCMIHLANPKKHQTNKIMDITQGK